MPPAKKATPAKKTAAPAAKKASAPAAPKANKDATVAELAPPPPSADSKESKSFTKSSIRFADDVADFVADTRKKLDKLAESHANVTASHTGAIGHEPTAYQLSRVASVLPDLDRALSMLSSVAGSLANEAATVEG